MIDTSFLTVRSNPKYENKSSLSQPSNYTHNNRSKFKVSSGGGINLDDLFNNNKNTSSNRNKSDSRRSPSNSTPNNIGETDTSPVENILDLSNDSTISLNNNIEFDNSLLPKFDDSPMFTLNKLQSGMGNINIGINSTMFSKITAAVELNDGNQSFVPDNSLYHHGILLGRDGGISIDLSKCWGIKRLLLVCTTNNTGVLSINSPEFGWTKNYQLSSGNGNFAELGFLYLFDNRIVVRKSFAHYSTLREVSLANGFSHIMWLDDNTPQIL